ncbi:MAG: bifunctional nuclease family protein [Halodesulfurarchaeum sp.]
MDASIEGVRVAGTTEGPVPVVLLGVANGDTRQLPIFIGFDEAVSIARGMDARGIGRPLTHDLMLDVIEELGGRVNQVVVSGLTEGTFTADLYVETPRDEAVIDARPSDSLALAARTDAPIAIEESVFEEGGRPREEFEDLEDIREVTEI